MKEHIKHDLVVNQSVYDLGIPFFEKVLGLMRIGLKHRQYGDLIGLPPLCIVVSEHEVVYDQAMLLAKRAKDQGVDVTVGVWKYMCHVFPLLCQFIPEGRMRAWISWWRG
jgi:acetyl esterase/lipase